MKFRTTSIAAITFLILAFFASQAFAQRAEIKIELTEQFFDALLDAVFQNAGPIEFPLSENRKGPAAENATAGIGSAFTPTVCNESIRILRESGGVRTSVRFREGKIVAPLAFAGTYNPPLVGCVDFAGTAEAIVDLQFDESAQRLFARARVTNVTLNGSGGLGGALVARMVQGSIDKKINPIEVISLDRMSFIVPVQKTSGIKMRAIGIRHAIANGSLNVFVTFQFEKA